MRRDERVACMHSRVLARFDELIALANTSPQDVDNLKRLKRRVRAVSARWGEKLISVRAASRRSAPRHLEHVVPVRVLTHRILIGDPAEEVLARAVTCVVLADEHRRLGTMLGDHADLLRKMESCPLNRLRHLGWRRYERAGVAVRRVA
jgi:hypothetical protein